MSELHPTSKRLSQKIQKNKQHNRRKLESKIIASLSNLTNPSIKLIIQRLNTRRRNGRLGKLGLLSRRLERRRILLDKTSYNKPEE